MKQYPLAKPYITSKDKRYVMKVLNSGYLSLGSQYGNFERAFAKKIGSKYACAVSNGTAGLHLALLAAGIRDGDEVITSPFSFVASSNAILYVGAKPVFADIDPRTYNMDPGNIEEKITKKTKAILVVHIFGHPAEMTQIIKIARKYNLKIIEDACESIGATYRGRQVGTFGESGVFSFYPNKQIITGEGGMVVTNNKRIYDICSSLANQGRTPNMQWLDHRRLGYNYRMDEMSAALGVAQLERLEFIIKQRRKIADFYTAQLKPHSDIIQIPYVDRLSTHSWFVYVIRLLRKNANREKIIEGLKARGIASKPYMPSIHLFSFYKKMGYKSGDSPVSEAASASTLALPFYIGLTREDIKYIVKSTLTLL